MTRNKKDADAAYAKLRDVCLAFPGADEKLSHGMPSFHVRGKMFTHFVDNDYYPAALSAWVKSTLAKQKELVKSAPDSYFVPKYVGPAGWIGVSLDPKVVDWVTLAMLIEEAWLAIVPPTVASGEAKAPKVAHKPPLVRVTTDEKIARAAIDKLTKICLAHPDVEVDRETKSATFRVKKKPFVYFVDNHHGDGIIAACIKGDPKANAKSIAKDPKRYYMPAYIGSRGFLGVRLDTKKVDWKDVEKRVGEAYERQNRKR
ncbi:MAG: MmcQ/YjbR family DNA-binding protein [Polyangiaceae bacterium]